MGMPLVLAMLVAQLSGMNGEFDLKPNTVLSFYKNPDLEFKI